MHLSYVFPECIAFGSSGGPEFSTIVHTSDNRDRSTFRPLPYAMHSYDASSGVKTITDYENVLELFHTAQGRGDTFDWKDWNDYKSCPVEDTPTNLDQSLGTGDGLETDFPIHKDYTIGTTTRRRPIQRPQTGSILVAGDGMPILSGWSWVENEFLLRFDVAPLAGVVLTVGYLYYVPVAFASNVFKNRTETKIDGEIAVVYPIDLEEVKLKTRDFP